MAIVDRADLPPGAWDRFCAESNGAWFWHTEAWLDYCLAYRPGTVDRSFALVAAGDDGPTVTTIMPLLVREDSDGSRCLAGDDPLPGALSTMGTRTTWEAIMEEFSERRGPSPGLARFRGSPLAEHGGEVTAGWRSQVLDLRGPIEALHSGLRRSYRSLVNAGLREFNIAEDPGDGSLCEAFRAVHVAASGGIAPRSDETYAYNRAWVRDGSALLLGARAGDRWMGFVLVIRYKTGAYYASGPALAPNVMHALQWEAIRRLKALGVQRYEIGWQGVATDEKGRQIEFFKRGFGGQSVPFAVSEITW